jgi:hypothetical protein
MRPLIWQARAAAARLPRALGRADDADTMRQAARTAVDDIASRISDPATRASVVERALAQIDGPDGPTS